MSQDIKEFVEAQAQLKSMFSFFADKALFEKAVKMTIEERYGKDRVDEIYELVDNLLKEEG